MIIKEIIKIPNDTFEEQMRIHIKLQYPKKHNYKYPQFENKPNPNRLARDDY